MKFRFKPTSINSIDRSMIRRFRLFKTIPKTPNKKIVVEKINKISRGKAIFLICFIEKRFKVFY